MFVSLKCNFHTESAFKRKYLHKRYVLVVLWNIYPTVGRYFCFSKSFSTLFSKKTYNDMESCPLDASVSDYSEYLDTCVSL